eukprot:gene10478-biopygen5869
MSLLTPTRRRTAAHTVHTAPHGAIRRRTMFHTARMAPQGAARRFTRHARCHTAPHGTPHGAARRCVWNFPTDGGGG